MKKRLSHVDARNRPRMVGVGHKKVTRRVARAEAILDVPPAVFALLKNGGRKSKKGPVFETATLAGIMGAKRTSELIPLCHPLPLEDCQVRIRARERNQIGIECRIETHHKTGVEMEALTGAAIAALTIYDMCKALSHDMVIREVRLMEKTGGKRDFRR